MTTKTYIGLGSNLGDSRQILSEAIAKLKTLGGVFLNFIKVHLWGLKINQII